MGSPIQAVPLAFALSNITNASSAVAEGNYGVTESIANAIASGDSEECALTLMAAFVAIAKWASVDGDVRQVLEHYSRGVISQTEFMVEVLDGIDGLGGDPLKDPFDDRSEKGAP